LFILPLRPSSPLPFLSSRELAYLPNAPSSLGDFFLPILSALSPSFGPVLLRLTFGSAILYPIYFPCRTNIVARPSIGYLCFHLGSSSPVVALSSHSGHFLPTTFLPDMVSILVFLFFVFLVRVCVCFFQFLHLLFLLII
jgi:hypothetical protein